ncbi:MAG TPA: aldehyde dehydrogenase family protein [Phycisphaerales bacterium]|nr:aldehyde dehydrogenase family protein [Phycisphaerales bacterium]
MERLEVLKTYKLYIDGKFPRSESGRSTVIASAEGKVFAHTCKASRKDFRDAVEAARKAQQGWQDATAYLRGQILYRIAEMIEGKRAELAYAIDAIEGGGKSTRGGKGAGRKGAGSTGGGMKGDEEVTLAIDRVVAYAGWADKYAQVLGCNNPVASAHYNFTVPEPTGVVCVVAPDRPSLLGLVSLACPVICAGNTAVVVASEVNPIPAAVLAEACATGDVPGGVVNILTGARGELVPFIAGHREVDGVHTANVEDVHMAALRAGAGENVKRVTTRSGVDFTDRESCESPWWIEPFVEMKTIWHPAAS